MLTQLQGFLCGQNLMIPTLYFHFIHSAFFISILSGASLRQMTLKIQCAKESLVQLVKIQSYGS